MLLGLELEVQLNTLNNTHIIGHMLLFSQLNSDILDYWHCSTWHPEAF